MQLATMVTEREKAMAGGDMSIAMAQFADDATWINSQGYYFEGKAEVAKFHAMLTSNDSLAYAYEAGQPRVRAVDAHTALVHYSWQMIWFLRLLPADTTYHEIGLMTLLARKRGARWHWIAVTNQHTPEFRDRIEPVRVE